MSDAETSSASNESSSVSDQSTTTSSGKPVEKNVHEKLMSEIKKERAEKRAALEKLQELEQTRLLAEGKKDEYIESLKKDLTNFKEADKRNKEQIVLNKYHGKLSTTLAKAGAKDAEILQKLFPISDFAPDANGDIDTDQILAKVEEFKKSRPYMFEQGARKIADGTPLQRTTGTSGTTRKEIAEATKGMNPHQMAQWMRDNGLDK